MTPQPHQTVLSSTNERPLADILLDLLPQTQCTKCGYPACHVYAHAMAKGCASHNQCPPGGAQGIERLASVLGKPVIALNPVNGSEHPRAVAQIDEQQCIGCTLCIQACPVDAIVGAAKQMHTVMHDLCTGCDLCVAPCPVDCISMVEATPGKTGWDAWTQSQADAARQRYHQRNQRLQREKEENEARLAAKATARSKEQENEDATEAQKAEQARKKAIIQAAIERARQKKEAAKNNP